MKQKTSRLLFLTKGVKYRSRMVMAREIETGLPYFRLMEAGDVKDPIKLAPFWSSRPEDQDDEVKKRVGSDGVIYLQSCIPIPVGLGDRCGDCHGIVAESRDLIGYEENLARVKISRLCLGFCHEQTIWEREIQVPKRKVLECLLAVKFP
jgi:hypothetical protein